MAVVIASGSLSDEEFSTALATCTLPLSSFRHGDHLRFAWIELHRNTFDDALRAVMTGIERFAAHHGVSHIFHHTLTTAWVKLLATHHEATFAEFIRVNDARLDAELLHRFWTPGALNSPIARSSWLPPDKEPLPT